MPPAGYIKCCLKGRQEINDYVIQTTDLTKRYGQNIMAVDSLSIRVKRG